MPATGCLQIKHWELYWHACIDEFQIMCCWITTFRPRNTLNLKRPEATAGRGKPGLHCQTSDGWAGPGWIED